MAGLASVNGRAISWSNLEFNLMQDGRPARIIAEFRSFSYDDTVNNVIVKGAGYSPISRTDGEYVPGSAEMVWLDTRFRAFASDVVGNSKLPLSSFDFMLQINKSFRGIDIVDFDKVYFSINSLGDEGSQGSGDPLETTIGCLLSKVERFHDGKLITL